MRQPDKIKRAVCDKVFAVFNGDASIEVWRNPNRDDPILDKFEGEVVATEELYRVVRYKIGDAGTRYFEIRVKELL